MKKVLSIYSNFLGVLSIGVLTASIAHAEPVQSQSSQIETGQLVSTQVSASQRHQGVDGYIKALKNHEISEQKIAIIYAILSNTHEMSIHQQNGATENKVYVHKDGHLEMVVDKHGEVVKDGVNDASYNYYHPSKQPLMHFTGDISPWIMLGQSPQDTTTVSSRIYAYMGDLEGGIVRTLEQSKTPSVEVNNELQITALAIFLNAIEQGGAEELFELFNSGEKLSDEKLINVLTKLNDGFNKTYLSK